MVRHRGPDLQHALRVCRSRSFARFAKRPRWRRGSPTSSDATSCLEWRAGRARHISRKPPPVAAGVVAEFAGVPKAARDARCRRRTSNAAVGGGTCWGGREKSGAAQRVRATASGRLLGLTSSCAGVIGEIRRNRQLRLQVEPSAPRTSDSFRVRTRSRLLCWGGYRFCWGAPQQPRCFPVKVRCDPSFPVAFGRHFFHHNRRRRGPGGIWETQVARLSRFRHDYFLFAALQRH